MKENQKKLHRGEVLAKVIQHQRLSKTVVAEKAGYNRTSLYNHIKTPDLSFEILEKYGKAMGHDFTREFPEMIRYIAFEDSQKDYSQPLTLEQLIRQRDQWREKYYDLLEKYNRLLEDKMNLGEK